MDSDLRIQPATIDDVPLLLQLIKDLAEYEQLAYACVATEDDLRAHLFGPNAVAHALVASLGSQPAGFALYFFNFSTFLARPGLYLEDLFVKPAWRNRGVGRALLAELARIAIDRRCGRMEWAVLNWNELALRVYRGIGAQPLNDWTVYRLTGDALSGLAAAAPAAPRSSAT
jgi:GNAT superfamily N-acetyltransferase